MIALSIKDGVLNFISVYKKSNQLNSESYGTLSATLMDSTIEIKIKKIN